MIRPRLLTLRSPQMIGRVNQSNEATTQSLNHIKQMITPSIKRSSTDILSALSSTVGKDPTAPHFQYIDDPAMIPTTLANKRSYYMAKEMGKRAARQLATEWPTLFAFDRDEPRLEVFRPQGQPDPLQIEPSEENLMKLIENRNVKDACILYERIRSDGIDITDPAVDELFKLTAYYNSEDIPLCEENEWHGLRNLGLNEKKEWMNAGVADLVYESLPSSPLRKAILICSLCKYPSASSIKRANQLFQEMIKSDSKAIPTRVFSSLMQVQSWAEGQVLLNEMNRLCIYPDENVWNALMSSASKIKSVVDRIEALRSTVGEMRSCGENGSLRIFNSILSGMSEEVGGAKEEDEEKRLKSSLSLLIEILEDLEKRESIEIVSTSDSYFFCTAMNMARRAGNLPLANRIVSLYQSPNNRVKLMTLTNEGIFYNSYVSLCSVQMQSIDEFYKLYIDHVPRVVGVSRQLALSVYKRLNATSHWRLLHRLIEDSIASRLMTDGMIGVEIRSALLSTQFQSLSPFERDEYSSLITRLVSIWTEFSLFTHPNNRRMQFKYSPSSISECALLLSRIGERERAWHLLSLLCDDQNSQGDEATIMSQGTVKISAITELLDDALRRGDGENAATCLELMSRADLPKQRLEQVAATIISRCKLSPSQSTILTGFVRLRHQ